MICFYFNLKFGQLAYLPARYVVKTICFMFRYFLIKNINGVINVLICLSSNVLIKISAGKFYFKLRHSAKETLTKPL